MASATTEGILAGAGTGATVGSSVVPGIGTAIGAVIGGVAGGIKGHKKGKKAKKKKKAQKALIAAQRAEGERSLTEEEALTRELFAERVIPGQEQEAVDRFGLGEGSIGQEGVRLAKRDKSRRLDAIQRARTQMRFGIAMTDIINRSQRAIDDLEREMALWSTFAQAGFAGVGEALRQPRRT